jgi:glycosyltransferase involved in cell wall biosynthesis
MFMRILMLSPQPFMESRGVPFSVYYHIKALGTLGHTVDLLAYPMGTSLDLPGMNLSRVPSLPFIHEMKVGPSLAKIPLDILMALKAWSHLRKTHYDYIFTHEEAGLIGDVLAPIFGCRHLYFMHSDLSQQIVSSNFTKNTWLIRCIEAVQSWMVRNADAALAICPDIERAAQRMSPETPIYMIENVAVDEDLPSPNADEVWQLRQQLGLETGPLLLYTGTLESYQGIDLLLQSAKMVKQERPDARYLLVGGRAEQVEHYRKMAEQLGIADTVRFVGKRSTEEMPCYMALADILLSPRSKGTNTPLKLYTYLRAGKPILATDILSHTQMLNEDIAQLVPTTAEGLAQGALALVRNPQDARTLGLRGQQFAQAHYSWPVFLEQCQHMYESFMGVSIEAMQRERELVRVS